MRALTVVALLALAACSPKPTPPAPAPVKAAADSDFSKPMEARGTEPFWALSIQGRTLTFTRPDQPVVTAIAPGAAIQPNQASWTGKMADGQTLKVTLYASACSDGMSDHAYGYTAEVDVPGQNPLSGCADKLTAMPKAAKR
jgi:uncharacterized membrane protein